MQQPFIATMIKIRKAFRLTWISPSSPLIKEIEHNNVVTVEINGDAQAEDSCRKRIEIFLDEVEAAFWKSTEKSTLAALSDGLRKELQGSLLDGPLCMLPSYNHQLPRGDECGTYLALDVGGSTFRVALITLEGSESGGGATKILESKAFKIRSEERKLIGRDFFDWMADRIADTLQLQHEGHEMSKPPLSTGLSWSFPIEQTSLRGGLLMGMGKGFFAAHGLIGQDLGDIIEESCFKKGLNIKLTAIVNDSSATLLSKAYLDPSTRFALILGTGMNAAVHLPVHIFSPSKFGQRPKSWHDEAKHVIVNTELSMFGNELMPYTEWDLKLKRAHKQPDFQPFEHLTSGGYLGEIVRLILLDGIERAGVWGGVVPAGLVGKDSLDTETLSRIESDTTPQLSASILLLNTLYPSTHPPTKSDILFIRHISSLVTRRASALIAAGVHALWSMRNEGEASLASIAGGASEVRQESENKVVIDGLGIKDENGVISTKEVEEEEEEEEERNPNHMVVAYNGSVLENYPGFRRNCQGFLDALVEGSVEEGNAKDSARDGGRDGERKVELMYAQESSLLGAAVAVAVAVS